MQALIDSITNGEAWLPVLIALSLRAFIKWQSAGRPNGIMGLIQSLFSFVPENKPQPGDDTKPITDDKTERPILNVLVPLLIEIFKGDKPDAMTEDEWSNARQLACGPVLMAIAVKSVESE